VSLTNLGLLLSFITEGVLAIKKFIADNEVKEAFKGLKSATTDDQRVQAAQSIAQLLYK
jgi:hypothetical protein